MTDTPRNPLQDFFDMLQADQAAANSASNDNNEAASEARFNDFQMLIAAAEAAERAREREEAKAAIAGLGVIIDTMVTIVGVYADMVAVAAVDVLIDDSDEDDDEMFEV